MSIITRSLTSYNNLLNILHNRSYYYKPTHHVFQSFFFINRRISHFHQLPNRNNNDTNKNNRVINYRNGFLTTSNLHYLTTIQRMQNARKFTRNITVYASIQPAGPPLPPGSPKSSWMSWIFGILVSIIFPFFTSKWGPSIKWTKDVESTVDTVEQLVDVVQVVAKKVDEEFSSDLPEGRNLKKAVALIEDVAGEIAKDAKFAGKIINKVQGAEEKLENQVDEPNQ